MGKNKTSAKSVWIEGKMPGMNEIIAAAKRHPQRYREMKQTWTDKITLDLRQAGIQRHRSVFLIFEWHEKAMRRDPDNIAAAKKFVMDALIKAEVIRDDNWKHIRGWQDLFVKSHKNGLWLTIE